MLRLVSQKAWAIAICCLVFSWSGRATHADSVVPFSIGPLYTNNVSGSGQSGWGGFGGFDYGSASVGPGPDGTYTSFRFDKPGGGGSGTGWTFGANADAIFNSLTTVPVLGIDAADYPMQDRAAYGVNFNPDNYVIEIEYKPGPDNAATVMNITVEQHDGFAPDPNASNIGKRRGEQLQWGVTDIVNYYSANVQPNGYAKITRALTNGSGTSNQGFTGPSFLFSAGDTGFRDANVLIGDTQPDFNSFQDNAPNGAFQIHLQSSFSAMFPERLQVDVRSMYLRPRNWDPKLVARLDARSGIGRRFGTPFASHDPVGGPAQDQLITYDNNGDGTTGATEFAYIRNRDQLQRYNQTGFTNLIINTDDDANLGGFGIWQDPNFQTFNGTQATLKVTARLTQPQGAGEANRVDVVLNDLDGNDTGAGLGAEEYRYAIDLSQFNQSTFTTVSIPLTAFTQRAQAFEVLNDGDASLANFNLYYMGMVTNTGIGVVDLEVESIEVRLPGRVGDYNENGVVDGADYVLWRDRMGTTLPLPNQGTSDGVATVDDYRVWREHFGETLGSGAGLGGTTIPEPGAWLITIEAAALLMLLPRNRMAVRCVAT